jgi:hypothetical protein
LVFYFARVGMRRKIAKQTAFSIHIAQEHAYSACISA